MQLDHITCIVPNLNESIEQFQQTLGCTPAIGGKHESFGTHNAILGLKMNNNSTQYLELLAIDPEDAHSRIDYPLGLSKDLARPLISSCAVYSKQIMV